MPALIQRWNSVVYSEKLKAVTAYLKSKQLLLFGFARQWCTRWDYCTDFTVILLVTQEMAITENVDTPIRPVTLRPSLTQTDTLNLNYSARLISGHLYTFYITCTRISIAIHLVQSHTFCHCFWCQFVPLELEGAKLPLEKWQFSTF